MNELNGVNVRAETLDEMYGSKTARQKNKSYKRKQCTKLV